MKSKTKRGGKREGSGRKEVADPVEPVTVYVQTSVLSTFGEDLDVKEQRIKCRAFFSETLAQRSKSLAR